MNRSHVAFLLLSAATFTDCGTEENYAATIDFATPADAGVGLRDLVSSSEDAAFAQVNGCGDTDPACQEVQPWPTFGLATDASADSVTASGVVRDANGNLVLDSKSTSGTYTAVIPGCTFCNGSCAPMETPWYAVWWDGYTPAGTSIEVRAKTGPSPHSGEWTSAWTPVRQTPPVDLARDLHPNHLFDAQCRNGGDDAFLLIEVQLSASVVGISPTIRSVTVANKCPLCGG